MSLSLEIFLSPQHTKYWLGSIITYFRIIPLSTSRISRLYTVSIPPASKVGAGDVNWSWCWTSCVPDTQHVPTSGLGPGEGSKTTQDKDTAHVSPPRWSHWCPGRQKRCQLAQMHHEASLPFPTEHARHPCKSRVAILNTPYPACLW